MKSIHLDNVALEIVGWGHDLDILGLNLVPPATAALRTVEGHH